MPSRITAPDETLWSLKSLVLVSEGSRFVVAGPRNPELLPDHDAEEFVYGKIRVIVNYERPWLSTAYEIGS